MMPLLSKNKIQGTEIATGKAKWGDLGDGTMGYVFDGNEDFHLRVNPQTLIDLGVSEEDMMDCVDQIEQQFGSHENLALSFGMYPDQGYKNVGLVFKSNTNPNVKCFFSPSEANKGWQGYFSWYYSKEDVAQSLEDFIKSYEKVANDKAVETLASPIVPSYNEASEMVASMKHLSEGTKDHFLANVWNYHKNVSPGFKQRLEQEIISEMESFRQVSAGA
jgi:hypothetical protein